MFEDERAKDAPVNGSDYYDLAIFYMLTLAGIGAIARFCKLQIHVGKSPATGGFAIWIDGSGLPSWWPTGSAVIAIALVKIGAARWWAALLGYGPGRLGAVKRP
jgi:hypothetical protein